MTNLLKQISRRKVVYWGVGSIQTETEVLTGVKACYYVDDDYLQKKDKMPKYLRNVKGTEVFMRGKGVIFVIVCAQNYDRMCMHLCNLGYVELDDYISWDRLLFEYEYKLREFAAKMHGRPVAFWGIGKTFDDYSEFLHANIKNVSFLIDEISGNKGGKPVHTFEQTERVLHNSYVIVTSTWYPIIAEKLQKAGMRPLDDFLSVGTYQILNDYYNSLRLPYRFTDRKKDSQNLLVILAGYKKPLWGVVFDRIAAFVPGDFDVCVVSSGVFSEDIDLMCKQNNWSYLTTEVNKITAALNSAIYLYKEARFVYKIDEDIFVTKGSFEKLAETYASLKRISRYEVGFVSPVIPVNTYGYSRILKILDIERDWESRFGEIKCSDGSSHHLAVMENPDAAKFLWGETHLQLRDIDALAAQLACKPLDFSICPFRYSIGMILFERETWIKMRLFPVGEGNDLGADEVWMCKYCVMAGKAMVIAENAIVGHLSYGPQTSEMLRFFAENRNIFERD